MGEAVSSPILRVIRQAVVSDRDLLRRFSELREAAAFHALLRRHGPMVVATGGTPFCVAITAEN
jgi:hypothetical protein